MESVAAQQDPRSALRPAVAKAHAEVMSKKLGEKSDELPLLGANSMTGLVFMALSDSGQSEALPLDDV